MVVKHYRKTLKSTFTIFQMKNEVLEFFDFIIYSITTG